MKTFYRFIAATALTMAASSAFQTAEAQHVNIEAATKYWEITDALRQNQPLTDEAWKEFLEIQGNKVYVKGVFSESDLKAYRKAIETVYMPQHDSLLQVKLKAGTWYYVLVNDYKTNEAHHQKYVQETSENPEYLDLMYTLAYEYLPQRAHTKVEDLQLYYNALGNDAASRSEGIFFSINAAINWNKYKEGSLEAHEIHHQIRPRREFGEVSEPDAGIMWALASVQNEGIADQIDKRVILEGGGEDAAGVEGWLLKPAPGIIQQLDTMMVALANNSAEASQPVKHYVRMFKGSGGHIPGFYMANVIERNGYHRKMIQTADDPFAFIRLYQKAAKKDKASAPVFSKASMAYLKKLEKKYAVKGAVKQKVTASL
ncbi:hypothetical protein DXT99_14120 [Pontibacter diazotrophicus]|uniref:DUF2268 domain-containing protein n=1 Tax=Pontibacter diazotrophicus TaxID=1400979 RepID=A0A3D8LAZ4_9BACT|nr:DUF5700 domain-containing putative Zn-dependent protease [Pontibacter diazotrophicus]RDV14533.1 hypothetical protein DXT99_14120 [Pontibacter diazotrophicus]